MSLASTLPVDHVILGVETISSGIELLERATGVKPVFGGAHPGRGTQNALLGLGDGRYLELMAPNYDDTSATGRDGATRRAAEFKASGPLAPIGWAVQVSNAEEERSGLVARGLRPSDLRPGMRQRPDGAQLRWRTFDPWGIPERGVLPFAIEWASDTPHPSVDAPVGCRLVDLVITSSAADLVQQLFERAQWPIMIRSGASEYLELTLDCPAGRVRFP